MRSLHGPACSVRDPAGHRSAKAPSPLFLRGLDSGLRPGPKTAFAAADSMQPTVTSGPPGSSPHREAPAQPRPVQAGSVEGVPSRTDAS